MPSRCSASFVDKPTGIEVCGLGSRTHVYVGGLKGMESGVDEAFANVGRSAAIDWALLESAMREDGRYQHVETY